MSHKTSKKGTAVNLPVRPAVTVKSLFLVPQVQFRVNENEGILWTPEALNLYLIVTLHG